MDSILSRDQVSTEPGAIHSGASLMLAQGTPLHVVSEVLGRRAATEAISTALLAKQAPMAPMVAPEDAQDTG
ncbi:hypothetical protein [Nonomuraea cavernae]|uniref:hypothetical protein n=1 Tax=Nonomuraea cavernae TaxID=2045107 RepID=UPI0033D02987